MKKLCLMFVLYVTSLISIGDSNASLNRHCYRFNPLGLYREEYYRDEISIATEDWINIRQYSGMCYFTAIPKGDINLDIVFNYIEPVDESARNCATNAWPVYIICQWDQEEGREIFADEEVSGDLLKTPTNCEEVLENDEDTYIFNPTCENYCIEIPKDTSVSIFIYPSSTSCPSNPINFVNTFSKDTKFNSNSGNIKRFYKTDWISGQEYIIHVKPLASIQNYYATSHSYSFSIKKVRPLVLLHGILAHPRYPGDPETTFGEIPEYLHLCADCYPVKVFDFPWDPGDGHYTKYCQTSNISLYTYIYQNCIQNYDLYPVLMAHSMGGIVTVGQMIYENDFVDMIDKYIFCGTPFCGADKANYSRMLSLVSYVIVYPLVFFYPGIDNQNLDSLRRGTDEVWYRLENIPNKFANKSVTYFAGLTSWHIVAGNDSDIVVSKSSANLSGTLELNQNIETLNMNHLNMKTISFPCDNDYKKLINCIFNYVAD